MRNLISSDQIRVEERVAEGKRKTKEKDSKSKLKLKTILPKSKHKKTKIC